MAKQLNVNLAFTADTSKALQTLQQLKQNLHSIASLDISSTGISKELKLAVQSAQALEQHMANAFNTKTGNLDLSKLNSSLKQSGASLATLSNNLLGAGLSGEKAFLQIQSSIASANTQLIKANGLISNFMTTLKNTARWQISSSLLHGFMGAIQSAYGYSQDLNESLNNIRIVTGQNIDQMAKFAEQANKAAKALSATTTDYTNASLIYYQQGLNEEEVKKRTNVTIKMANAAGQSAETVSDQLTAVWNNFYDGTKSLEYYADVMTALGAATASSTDEIAGGLEKFAAIGETIGLSYEYAASALATITANTRQSEEVVGTALKTIFARIQGLNLGETLEDGTTLNKYSQALEKIGISIFEQNGELKDMDNILNEMGAKWQTLAKDQQTALAQTVAGVRQYTQLVALMDNWNKGDNDSMMANLQTSYNAEGTLQEQAEIYEESWEAASKRVKTSLQTIYAEMVPDETFIDLMNGLEDVLNLVGMVVKGFGGLEGVLMLVSSIMLTKFAPNIGQALQTGIEQTAKLKQGVSEFAGSVGKGFLGNLQSVSTAFSGSAETAKSALQNTQEAARGASVEIERQQKLMLENASIAQRVTAAFKDQVNSLKQTTDLTSLVKNNSQVLTKETSEQLLEQIKQVQTLGEKKALLLEELDIIKQENANLIEGSMGDFYDLAPEQAGQFNLGEEASQRLRDNLSSVAKLTGNITLDFTSMENHMQIMQNGKLVEDFSHLEAMVEASVEQIIRLTSATDQLHAVAIDEDLGKTDKAVAMNKILAQTKGLSEATKTALQNAINAFAKDGDVKKFQTAIRQVGRDATKVAEAFGISEKNISNAVQQGHKLATNTRKVTTANNEYNQSLNTTINNIQTALAKATAIGPTIAKGFSNLSSVAMSISMLSNAFDTLTDSEASFGQKLTTTTMALSMGFSSFLTIIKGVNAALTALNSTSAITHVLNTGVALTADIATKELAEETMALIVLDAVQKQLNEDEIANQLVTQLGISSKQASALASFIKAGAEKTDAAALKDKTAKEVINTIETKAGTQANLKYAASQLLKNKYMLIAIAILAALAIGVLAVVKAEKQRIETNKKTAESSQEAAKAAQEEADANKELIDSYYAALKAQDGTKESKDALYAAALKVAKAYGIEGAAADALAGDYENLTKKILAARKAELQGSKGSNDIAITTTTQALLDALRKGKGHVSGSTYTGTFGTSGTGQDILKDGDYQFLTSNNNGKISFDIPDFSNTKDVYAYYQEIEKLIAEYRAKAETDDSIILATDKVYQEALKELNEGKEAYTQLKELYGENNDILLELGTYMAKTSSGDSIVDIDSLSEYEDFYKNYIKYLAEQKGITEENAEAYKALEQEALGYLSTQEDLAKYALDSQGFKDKFGERSSEDLEEIKEFYNSLSEEEKELFWQVDIDEDASLDNIRSYIEQAQNLLDSNKLNVEIKTNNELSDLIGKENKTEDDWTAIREGFESGNYDIDYTDFLKMSQKEQQAYLEAYAENLKNNQSATLETSVQKAEDIYNEAVKERDTKQGTADYSATQKRSLQAEYEAKQTNLQNKVSNYTDRWKTYDTGNGTTYKAFTNDDGSVTNNLDDIYNYLANNQVIDDVTLGLYRDAFDVSNQLYGASGFYQGGQSQITNASGEIIADYGDQTAFDYLLEKVESIARVSGYKKDTEEYNTFVNELLALLDNQGNSDPYNYTWSEFGDSLIAGIETYGETHAGYYGTTAESYGKSAEIYEEESQGYDTAVETSYEAYIKQLQNAQELQAEYNKEVKDAGIDLEEYEAYKDLLAETYEELSRNEKALHQVAVANKKMEKGVKTLSSNWKTWNTILKDDSLEDFSTIAPEVNGAIQEILNLNDQEFSLLPPDFAKNNLDLLQDVVNGVEGSVDALRNKAGEEILMTIDGVVDPDGTMRDELWALHQNIAGFDNAQFEIGAKIDDADFIASCNDMIARAGMTAEQAQAYFASMGYDAEIEEKPVEKISKRTVEYPIIDERTGYPTGEKGSMELTEITGTTGYAIKTITPNGSYGGGVGVNTTAPSTSTSSAGGNTSPAEKVKKTNKSDIVDRYKEIDDALDDLSDALSDANKQSDRLFGANRIAALEKEQGLLLKQIDALKKKKTEAQKNLELDKQALKNYAEKNNINLNIDNETDLISNYTTELTKLYNELAMAEEAMDKMSTKEQQDDFKEATLQPIEDKISELKDLIAQYEETRELLEDLDNEIDDAFYSWQDKNYEELTYRLELKIDINDAELQRLDYLLNKYSDNFYKMAESAALLSGQLTPRKDNLSDYASLDKDGNLIGGHVSDLTADYNSNKISQADYIDGLKETRDNIYGELEALIDLDKQMMHYYEDTLSTASEELADYTDHMENLTNVFDHYVNLMEILGKQKDYNAMGNFLSGKADTLRDRLDVAQEYYEVMLSQRAVVEQELNAAIARGDEAAIELHKKEWDAIIDATDEAQEEVLSLTEEWAEAMKAVIENNMAEIGDTLEKALTKGLGFEKLMDDFDKLNERQEEYLTKTNKVYETNKLMRTANKALDETDNKVAKQKLKNFIDETKSLQENTQLSKYELEIQQAKYDLLLAEIALEEAQNAKSTVRLSRDNEGNFGYIYTADQDKVSDAEQNVEDAKNNLYNISLKGQQDYTNKYLQSLQSFYQQRTEMDRQWKDGEIASEELYHQMKTDLMEHYFGENGVLTSYSHLYNIAVQTDAAATADYWGYEYGLMTQNTAEWKNAVDQYVIDITKQTENWKEVSEQCNEDVSNALDDSETATRELKNESKALRNELINSVVPGIKTEIEAVKTQTTAYANQRAELQRLISTYEAYLRTLNKNIAEASKSSGNEVGDVKTPITDEDKTQDVKENNASSLASEAQAIVKGVHNGSIAQTSAGWKPSAKAAGYSDEAIKIAQKAFNDSKAGGGYDYYYNEALKLAGSYDTGGYTGAWGPEGKLAFLHEKELILNKEDTSNLLSTVSFIRDIVSMINSQASMASMFNMAATSSIAASNEILEQSVTIHAEFPNATDRNEIEEAFNNLVNRASQYANRK